MKQDVIIVDFARDVQLILVNKAEDCMTWNILKTSKTDQYVCNVEFIF